VSGAAAALGETGMWSAGAISQGRGTGTRDRTEVQGNRIITSNDRFQAKELELGDGLYM
jgi:hypothetical protein